MRIGICGCMIHPERDPVGIDVAEVTAGIGYDYIELSLRDVAALDAEDFSALARRLEKSGLRSEACNNFFPPERRITGPDYDLPSLRQYTRGALERARTLGAEAVVFGSSGARNIPGGFPRDRAWSQIVEASRMIDEEAERAGITIAIEYHNRREANVLTSMSEALRLGREVDRPRIQILFDYYHFAVENEPPDVIREAGSRLVHGHFAELRDRAFPREPKREYRDFFAALADAGYRGRLSIEAYTKDFTADAEKALEVIRGLAAGM